MPFGAKLPTQRFKVDKLETRVQNIMGKLIPNAIKPGNHLNLFEL